MTSTHAPCSVNNRIDFFDFSKGICIILVVLYHLQFAFDQKFGTIIGYTSIFRMPLYFFLSGFFFKQYDGVKTFLLRKTNNLLIPFFSFYLLFTVLFPNLLYILGYLERSSNSVGWHTLWQFIYPEYFFNGPIWFLLCLFEVNMYYYLLYSLSLRHFNYKEVVLLLASFSLGAIGYLLDGKTDLPCFFDTSLTAMPFFCVGNLVHERTRILEKEYNYLFIVVILIVSAILLIYFPGAVIFRSNTYHVSFLHLLIIGFIGIIFVLFLGKMFIRNRIINYWGRYSIMILVTHQLLILFYLPLVLRKFNGILAFLITFFMVMVSYFAIIPLMKRYLPYITAQKQVLH